MESALILRVEVRISKFKASLGLQETLIQNTKTKSWVWWLLGVVVHAFDPSIKKAKFRGSLVYSELQFGLKRKRKFQGTIDLEV